jgi:hypothetical protein
MVAVPLEDWIKSLPATSRRSGLAGKRTREAPAVQINFIQVCRDYMRSPWKCLADEIFLRNLYDAGTAFYTYPGCDLIDFVAPSLIHTGHTKPTYSSVLVSIKSRLYFSPGDAQALCKKLKEKVDECKLKSALCVVCVFGQTSESVDNEDIKYNPSILKALLQGDNIATVLRIAQMDRYGLTDIFLEMTAATENSELLSSYSFLRAQGQKLTAKDALRVHASDSRRKAVIDFQALLKDMESESDQEMGY